MGLVRVACATLKRCVRVIQKTTRVLRTSNGREDFALSQSTSSLRTRALKLRARMVCGGRGSQALTTMALVLDPISPPRASLLSPGNITNRERTI